MRMVIATREHSAPRSRKGVGRLARQANSQAGEHKLPATHWNIQAWKKWAHIRQRSDVRRSAWQIINTIVPYIGIWALMVASLQVSYWLTLALAVPAAGLLVRTFIICHDAGHGSFWRTRRANRITEYFTALITFTAFAQWRNQHAQHHATSGDLDRRGSGDVWTMTIDEYLAAPKRTKFAYRLMRHPLFLFTIAPFYVFVIRQRIPASDVGKREHMGVHLTNLGLAVIAGTLCLTIGWKAYLMVQLPIILIAGSAGVWLFYVQHQFEGTYWARKDEWDYEQAAIRGSSFYQLPKVLQWFTGSIGYHHIHHLCPSIPNYHLERCHNSAPVFRDLKAVTLRNGWVSMTFRLWDEKRQRLISFRELKTSS